MGTPKETIEYAQKLVRYFEEHLKDRPEWEPALLLAKDWCCVLRKKEPTPPELAHLEQELRQLCVPEGSAVEELRMMMSIWRESRIQRPIPSDSNH